MKMLKENEWNTINSMLLEIYAIKDFDRYSKTLLKMFRMLIPYTKGYFLVFNENQEIDREKSYFIEMSEEIQQKYMDYFYNIDYLNYVFDFEKSTSVYRDTDILEDEIRKKTEFYTNFLKPQDIPFGCGIILIKDGKILGIVNLFRSDRLGDFTDKDMYILDVLKLHLANIVEKLSSLGMSNEYLIKASKNFIEKYDLSSREMEIVKLMNSGFSNADIAKKLIISISTVKKHIYNIYSKVGVKSRTQLLALFNS